MSTKHEEYRAVKASQIEKEVKNRKDFTNLNHFCETRNAIFEFEEVLNQPKGGFQRKSSQPFGKCFY